MIARGMARGTCYYFAYLFHFVSQRFPTMLKQLHLQNKSNHPITIVSTVGTMQWKSDIYCLYVPPVGCCSTLQHILEKQVPFPHHTSLKLCGTDTVTTAASVHTNKCSNNCSSIIFTVFSVLDDFLFLVDWPFLMIWNQWKSVMFTLTFQCTVKHLNDVEKIGWSFQGLYRLRENTGKESAEKKVAFAKNPVALIKAARCAYGSMCFVCWTTEVNLWVKTIKWRNYLEFWCSFAC